MAGLIGIVSVFQRQLMEAKQQKKRQARAGGLQTNDAQSTYPRPGTAKSKNREESKPLMDLSSSRSSSMVTPLHGMQFFPLK